MKYFNEPKFYTTKGSRWEDILPAIERKELVYETWKPSKILDKYKEVREIWECYNSGEAVFDEMGNQTGLKPPLRLLEMYLGAEWRTSGTVCILLY